MRDGLEAVPCVLAHAPAAGLQGAGAAEGDRAQTEALESQPAAADTVHDEALPALFRIAHSLERVADRIGFVASAADSKGIVRLITRNDTSLVVGLIAGTIVVFQRPFRFVWDLALDVQKRYHVDLVPALTIFAGVLLFHEYRKRQQTKADSVVAGIEAAQARKRSEELERLMTLSQALANARDQTALHQVLWRYLPAFLGEREFWLLTRQSDRWDTLLAGHDRRAADAGVGAGVDGGPDAARPRRSPSHVSRASGKAKRSPFRCSPAGKWWACSASTTAPR